MIGENVQFKDMIKKTEAELEEAKENLASTVSKLTRLEISSEGTQIKLETKVATIMEELDVIKEECATKTQLHSEVSEELDELKIRFENQSTEINQKEDLIKELTSQLELLNLNMQQVTTSITGYIFCYYY